jgi:hypothetical protein
VNVGLASNRRNRKLRKRCAIQPIIKRQKLKPVVKRMSPDQKIGQDATWPRFSLSSSAEGIRLECAASGAPDGFVQIPIN